MPSAARFLLVALVPLALAGLTNIRAQPPAALPSLPPAGMPPAKLDRSAILKELRDTSLAGMHRRLGPDYATYHKPAEMEKFPEIYLVPAKELGIKGRKYQVGGPPSKSAGDFSSTQGQICYVPDNGVGVDRVTIIEWTNNCFTEKPEPPWWGGFRPEPTSKTWLQAAGRPGVPLASARGMGGWANCGLILFSSGFVGTAGTATGHGSNPTFAFPPSKLVTAISVTNKSEFALVTLVDTEKMKGQVAVLALESSGRKSKFAHEWSDDYPCLPNVAVLTNIKLLGYVDLPDMTFPTCISAVGNRTGGRVNGRSGHAGLLREYDLARQADRDNFFKGSNAGYVSDAGFAVVISKYDRKAAFIDLQPLFAKVREAYFTTEEKFKQTRDLGPGPRQWPPTFEGDPSWKPTVVKTIPVESPTAVLASMTGGPKARAYIASLDGTLTMYKLGGLGTKDAAAPDEIAAAGTVKAGRNPVCLAYQKGNASTLIVVSRGDREISWVKNTNDTLDIFRRLRDARLLDPVFVEVADTHGIEGPILTVADFAGRKILNYRHGTLTFATQGGAKFGMGPDGKDEFECGGTLEFPGHPVSISASNVN